MLAPVPAAGPAAGAVADESVDDESPSTLTALPPAVTGTAAPTGTWMPLRMPSSPDVLAAEPAPEPAAGAAGAADEPAAEPADDESPRTLTALPPTVTGISALTGAWMPEATPSAPDVVAPEPGAEATGAAGAAGAAAGAAGAELESLLAESPTALMALPATVTGTLTCTSA